MAKTLVTGGTGFLGAHLTAALVERGDEVRVLSRTAPQARHLDHLEVERLGGSVLDRRAVKRAFKGVDRVFHCAGIVSFRSKDADTIFEVNVEGTRTVMEEALAADVERALHVSSAATFGPATDSKAADESQLFTAGPLGIPYVNAKREAEVEALRVAAHGLPLVCVNPTVAFGPGDRDGHATAIVGDFLRGRFPAYVPGTINIVDVRDIAIGALLADSGGRVGERYILGGRNFTQDRLFADLARLSGIDVPARIPYGVAMASLLATERLGIDLGIHPDLLRASGQQWSFRSEKARRELGFRARPHEETLEATVEWHRTRLGSVELSNRHRPPLPLRLAARAAGAVAGRG